MKIWLLKFAFAASLFVPTFAASSWAAPAAPQDMKGYESNIGKSYVFTMTGTDVGSVWGTDTYTTDSFLTTAAVHAGVLKKGVTQDVEVMVVAGQASYKGSTRNGVTTSDWSSYDVSFRFVKKGDGDKNQVAAVKPAAEKSAPADTTAAPTTAFYKKSANGKEPDAPSNMYTHKEDAGKTFTFIVKGTKYGQVYGTGTYTIDSYLAAAAVHAGVLKIDEVAEIQVTVLPAQTEFKGSASNGVTTMDSSDSSACFKFK